MSYFLEKITENSLSKLRENWRAQLDSITDNADFVELGLDQIMAWCDANINKNKGEHCFWVLYDVDTCSPKAIIEMTDARRSKESSFKLLNVYFEPALALDYKESIEQEELFESVKITSYAIVESLKTALQYGAQKLKIFGRTNQMLGLFDSLLSHQDLTGTEIKMSRHNNWLVIEKTKN